MRGADMSKVSSSKIGYRPRPRSTASSAVAAWSDSARSMNRRGPVDRTGIARAFHIGHCYIFGPPVAQVLVLGTPPPTRYRERLLGNSSLEPSTDCGSLREQV